MIRLALLVAFAAACTTPEEAVVEAGGKAPVLCLREDDNGWNFCRDARRTVFACRGTGRNPPRCVAADRPRAVLDGVLEVGK